MLERTVEEAVHELRAIAALIGGMSQEGTFPREIRINIALFLEYSISERVEILAKELGIAPLYEDEETDTKKGINTQMSAVGAADKNMDINSHS